MTGPGRDEERIRRWIRGARLRRRVRGGPPVGADADLEAVAPTPEPLPIPEALRRFDSGRLQPDWAEAIHRSRRER